MKKMMTDEERIERRKHRKQHYDEHRDEILARRKKNRPDRGKKRRERDPDFYEKIKRKTKSRNFCRAWKREMNKTWEVHHFNGDEDPMNFAYLPKEEHRRLHAIYGDNKALSEEIIINEVKTPCVIFHDGKFEAFINGQFQLSKEA